MRHALLTILVILLLPLSAFAADVVSVGEHGLPTFLRGDLGQVDALGDADPREKSLATHRFELSAQSFMDQLLVEHYGAHGTEEMEILSARRDDLGQVHVRFQQHVHGLPVEGAVMMLHADAASGDVYAVNGTFAPAGQAAVAPSVVPDKALSAARAKLGVAVRVVDDAELSYVLSEKGDRAVLAWKTLVEYDDEEGFHRDLLFTDATTGEYVTRHPQIHTAKSWKTYTANNGTSLPGSLLCTGTQSCGSSTAQDAHDNASGTYDYYSVKFGRDSLNNAGMTMVSTVNYQNNYNNAFWNGSQMVYGDGDGTTFSPLGGAFDVVAHELTHGVTDFESDLIYQNESGALNEALSDVFAAAAEAWQDGGVSSNTWKIDEDVYTPGTSGDALRYMDNPTQDGSSYDYYPERYTGTQDNGGVHWNSGIANLAFVLAVQGGSHPRGKTSVNVPAIGMSKAEQIFYRAQVSYLTSSATFQDARNATAQAASDLYGSTEVDAIHDAWCAVGVPGCPSGGGTTALSNGVPETNLSGSQGSEIFFTLDVPSGASDLSFDISGGSGDADLYVKYGSAPTTSSYDCRPWKNGNNETCSFSSPQAGTWHVMIRGYSSYSGVDLVGSYTAGGGSCGDSGAANNLSGSQGSEKNYTWDVPSCATTLTIAISGGSGDADLYVKYGSSPTTSSFDCRPYKYGNEETCTFEPPQAGTYYIMVRGYSSYSGVDLTASHQ